MSFHRQKNMTDTEKRYFYTFGTDPRFPFEGGWVEVLAINQDEANSIFRHIFPGQRQGLLNCAFSYTEEEFMRSKMAKQGNFGKFCQRKLGVDDLFALNAFEIPKAVKIGDRVYVIDKIMYIYADEESGYSIEFIDKEGKYRNWKQYFDGGYALFRL